MKKFVSILLALILCVLPLQTAFATETENAEITEEAISEEETVMEETEETVSITAEDTADTLTSETSLSGTYGNLSWTLEDGVMTFTGTGEMPDWGYAWWDEVYLIADEIITVVISDGITCIGNYAFANCENLVSISIPDSVTRIGSDAFLNCTSLESIALPENLTELGYASFDGCTSLTSVVIPASVTEIGFWAFLDCTSLESVTIYNASVSIGSEAFGYVYSLESSVGDCVRSGDLCIYGLRGSTAKTYAMNNDIEFVQMDEQKVTYADSAVYSSKGFFQWVANNYPDLTPDAENALSLLAQAPSTTVIGGDGDATSLPNLLKTVAFLKECNSLRAAEKTEPTTNAALSELKVSLELMAAAEVQANISAYSMSHTLWYPVPENLAWGYRDPFDGWYTEEKAAYTNGTGGQTGHYLAIVHSEYYSTGFAVNQYGSYGSTFSQVFSWTDSGITVSEFSDLLDEYVSKNGVVKLNGIWGYYVDGELQSDYTGFQKNSSGTWYIEKGKVTFTTNGIFQDKEGSVGTKGTWYYVVGSQVQIGYTGVGNYSNSSGWWYIKNGKVDFSANTVASNKYGWWYVVGGKVQFGYTGVANYANSSGWWYIKNGKVDFSANTVASNKYGWWYVVGGKVQFGYTGVANYANSSGWWYIKNGKVDFSFNGIASNKSGSWVVKGGKVNFSYNGTYKYNGKTYRVSGGKVR